MAIVISLLMLIPSYALAVPASDLLHLNGTYINRTASLIINFDNMFDKNDSTYATLNTGAYLYLADSLPTQIYGYYLNADSSIKLNIDYSGTTRTISGTRNSSSTFTSLNLSGITRIELNGTGNVYEFNIYTGKAPNNVSGLKGIPDKTEITLTWSDPSNSDLKNIEIYRNGALITTVNKGVRTYTDKGLYPDTSYTYKVVAVNNVNNKSTGVTLNVMTLSSLPPQEVSQVVTIPMSQSTIKINWIDPQDVNLKNVEIYVDDIYKTTIEKGIQQCSLSSLVPFRDYKITIKTVSHDLLGSTGVIVYARTLEPNMTPPSEINNLQSFVYADRIKFTWINPPEIDYHEVRIFRGGVQIATAVTPASQFTDYDLDEHTTYTFLFRSVNQDGAVSQGVSVTETTKGKPRGKVTLQGSVDEGSASLSWTQNAEADKYYVYRDGIKIAEVMDTFYKITGLTNGQTYKFTVQPINQWGDGDQSNEVRLTPIETPVPTSPIVSYKSTHDTITLNWSAVDHATEYRIYKTTNNGSSLIDLFIDRAYAASEQLIGVTSATSYTITGLTLDESMTLLVSAANIKGESAKTTIYAKTTKEIKWGVTAWEFIVAVFQFIMIFANFIILGGIIIFAPRVVRFFKELSRRNGVKF